jgi:hypothetical protein
MKARRCLYTALVAGRLLLAGGATYQHDGGVNRQYGIKGA